MRKIKSVKEFLELINSNFQGAVTLDHANKELHYFVSNYADSHNRNSIASQNMYLKLKENFVYILESTFNFGQYKSNSLRDVYKCAPNYIEWCIFNSTAFIIHPKTFEILQSEKVFSAQDLSKFKTEVDAGLTLIKLSKANRNNQGFLELKEIKEETFTFSNTAIELNNDKINSRVSTTEMYKGGDWENMNNNRKIFKLKKRIKILTK